MHVFSQRVVASPVDADAGPGAALPVGRAAAVGVNDHSITCMQQINDFTGDPSAFH